MTQTTNHSGIPSQRTIEAVISLIETLSEVKVIGSRRLENGAILATDSGEPIEVNFDDYPH